MPRVRTRLLVEQFVAEMYAARPVVMFAAPVLQALSELAVRCYELGTHDAHQRSTVRAPEPRAGQYRIVNGKRLDGDDE